MIIRYTKVIKKGWKFIFYFREDIIGMIQTKTIKQMDHIIIGKYPMSPKDKKIKFSFMIELFLKKNSKYESGKFY